MKKIFDKKLYMEAIRQIGYVAILLWLLTLALSIIPAIEESKCGPKYSLEDGSLILPSINTGIERFSPALVLFMFVGSILLVLIAFSFLTKRTSSDYYHSLPHSRLCIYVSIVAAVLTCVYAIIISTVLFIWLTFALTGLPLTLAFVPQMILFYMICSTLVIGAALIAVSLTGTRLSAAAVTILIVLLPRAIAHVFVVQQINMAPIVSIKEMGILVSPSYHLPSALIYNTLSFSSLYPSSEFFTHLPGLVYTAVMGVLYLFVGLFLFRIRPSESAGRSTTKPYIQHIIRIAIALFILLLLSMIIAQCSVSHNISLVDYLNEIQIFIALSFAVYLIYELLSNKSIKKMLRSMPLYLVSLALAVGIGFGSAAYGQAQLHKLPDQKDILYATVIPDYGHYIFIGQRHPELSYNHQLIAERVHHDDPELIALLHEGLAQSIDFYDMLHNNQATATPAIYTQAYTFHLKNGRTLTRQLQFTGEQLEKLQARSKEHPDYQKYYRALPDDSEITDISADVLGEKACAEIWSALRSELSQLDDQKFDQMTPIVIDDGILLKQENAIDDHLVLGSLTVRGMDKPFKSIYYLTPYTPEATTHYFTEVNRLYEQSFKDAIQSILDGSADYSYQFSLKVEYDSTFNQSPEETFRYYDSLPVAQMDKSCLISDETHKVVLQYVLDHMDNAITLDEPLINVALEINSSEVSHQYMDVYINLSESEYKKIIKQ